MGSQRIKWSLASLAALALAVLAWAPSASADQAVWDFGALTETPFVQGDVLVGELANNTTSTLVAGNSTVTCTEASVRATVAANGGVNDADPVELDIAAGDILFGDGSATDPNNLCTITFPAVDPTSASNDSAIDAEVIYDSIGDAESGSNDGVITIPQDTNPSTWETFTIDFTVSGAECTYANSAGDIVLGLDQNDQKLNAPRGGSSPAITVNRVVGGAHCPGPTATFTADWEGNGLVDADSDGQHDDPVGDLAMID